MILCALDLATVTGWVIGEVPEKPLPLPLEVLSPPKIKSGHVRFGKPGCEIGPFMSTAESWLVKLIRDHTPGMVVFESPIMPTVTQIATLRKLYGIAALIEKICNDLKIPVREAAGSTVYKAFGVKGKGKERKENCIAACVRYGWYPQDDNEADAMILWHYGASLLIQRNRK